MSIRITSYHRTDDEGPRGLAWLQVIYTSRDGDETVTASMCFVGATPELARQKAEDWWSGECGRQAMFAGTRSAALVKARLARRE
jgi:hypothetical protein